MDDRAAALAFSNSTGVGPKSYQNLIRLFGSPAKAWQESSQERYKEAGVGKAYYEKFESFRKTFDIKDYLARLKKAKVEFIPFGDKYYPVRLSQIDSPPIGLYIKGNKELLLGKKLIGVVGARKTTSYGFQVTETLVSELVLSGFIIVSGMAMGIDAIAHKTTMENKGETIAVLGCGVDCPYPRENDRLYEEILDSRGLVVSEYPLGMPANPGTFPARNRIVAGISMAVLITEAAEESGSLITAEHAISQGKTVFAVPGPITSQQSRGALKLLKQGAVLVQNAQDILNSLNLKSQISNSEQIDKIKSLKLTKEERKVLDALEGEEKTIDELIRETKIPISQLSVILSGMELAGIISSSNGKFTIKY